MLLKYMRYFVKVVECNSFTEAAEECFISQSAISQGIRSLEAEVGVQLIKRENRRFSLTPSGEYFYRQSIMILDETDRLCQETRRKADMSHGRLSVGYARNYVSGKLQEVVADYISEYSDSDIEVKSGNHEELYHDLKDGRLDVVVNFQRRALSDEYVNYHLCKVYCYIEISALSSMARLDKVSIEELKGVPCIVIAAPSQREIEQEFYKNTLGFEGNFIFASSLEEARILVAGNKGFLPLEDNKGILALEPYIKRIALERGGMQIERELYAFWRKDRDKESFRRFAELLRISLHE